MHWNLYKDSKPSSGERCIVAYISQGKTMAGIFTYCLSGSTSYWKNDSGQIVYCRDNQQWYYVSSIIDAVAQRLEDELREELQRGKV